jgi:hypothetical protein
LRAREECYTLGKYTQQLDGKIEEVLRAWVVVRSRKVARVADV